MQTCAVEGYGVVSATNPHVRLSRFPRLEPLFNSNSSSIIHPHEADWTSFQTNYFSENRVATGIERETSGSVARSSDRPQKRSIIIIIIIIIIIVTTVMKAYGGVEV
jgi:hypothetical protein